MDGEAIKDLFYLAAEDSSPVTLDLPSSKTNDCCFSLPVLADAGSSDTFKNDVNRFIWWFSDMYSSAALTLWKYSNGTYSQVAALNTNTLGTFYAFGFWTNDAGEKHIGYQLKWKNVLAAHGEGTYKVRCVGTLATSGTITYDSQEYCLSQYFSHRADGTVKLEYYINGVLGISEDDKKKKDFGVINWYNSLRLPGFFGFPESTYEKDYVQYNNGQRLYVEDEQEPEYILKLKPVPFFVHELLRIDVMQADQILITDYNSKNAGTFIQKAVQPTSEYKPGWRILQSKLAPVELKFRQEYNNLKKLRV